MTKADNPLDSLKAELRADHPMRRPINQDTVWGIAEEMVRRGLRPTQEAVRQLNGGGSPNAIHPLLQSFFAKRLPVLMSHTPPPHVPEALLTLWTKAKALALPEARKEAELALAAEREEFDAERALQFRHHEEVGASLKARALELDDRQKGFDKLTEHLDARERALEARAQAHEDLLAEQRETVRVAIADRDAARADALKAEGALVDTTTLLRAQREATTAAIREAEVASERLVQLTHQLAAVREAHETLQDQLAEKRRAEDALQRQIASKDSDLRSLREQLEKAMDGASTSRVEAAMLRTKLDGEEQRADSLTRQLAVRDAEVDTMRRAQEQLTEQLTAMSVALTTLQSPTARSKKPKPAPPTQ